MELGGVPQKIDEYFHWGPIFYVKKNICKELGLFHFDPG